MRGRQHNPAEAAAAKVGRVAVGEASAARVAVRAGATVAMAAQEALAAMETPAAGWYCKTNHSREGTTRGTGCRSRAVASIGRVPPCSMKAHVCNRRR